MNPVNPLQELMDAYETRLRWERACDAGRKDPEDPWVGDALAVRWWLAGAADSELRAVLDYLTQALEERS